MNIFLLSLGSAALFTLPFPGLIFKEGLPWGPVNFVLSLIGMALFFKTLTTLSRKKSLIFLASFLAFFTVSLYYWVTIPIHEFKNIPMLGSHLFGIVFYLVNYAHYFLLWLIASLARPLTDKVSFFWKSLLLAFGIAFFDHFYHQIFTLQIGTIFNFLSSPLWASVGGTPLLTFVTVFSILVFWQTKRAHKFVMLGSLFLIVTSVELSSPFYLPLTRLSGEKKIDVSLVQPNITNFVKLRAEVGEEMAIRISIQALARQTRKAKGLIIWPETAITYPVKYEHILPGKDQHKIYEAVLKIRSFIFGTYIQGSDGTITNSMLLWDQKKMKRYDKGYLKPFSEVLPFGIFSDSVAKFFGLSYPLRSGVNTELLKYGETRFMGSICYESLQPTYFINILRNMPERPHFIINIANDAWFAKTSEPYIHFFMNQWLSRQMNLPLIRTANTGITGIVYPDGRKEKTLPWFEESVLNEAVVYYETRSTLFELCGFWSTTLVASLFVLIYLMTRKFRSKIVIDSQKSLLEDEL